MTHWVLGLESLAVFKRFGDVFVKVFHMVGFGPPRPNCDSYPTSTLNLCVREPCFSTSIDSALELLRSHVILRCEGYQAEGLRLQHIDIQPSQLFGQGLAH